MTWIFSLIIIILLIFLLNIYLRKKRLKLIDYLTKNWGKPKANEYYDFNAIEEYFLNFNKKEDIYHTISNQTYSDLDFNEIFKYIDRTTSKIGQQYLYFKIRTIKNLDKLYKFENFTDLFKNNNTLRLNCQIELLKLNTAFSYDFVKLVNKSIIKKPKFHNFLIPLSLFSISATIAGFFNPMFFLLLIPIFLTNAVLHYKTKEYIRYYLSAVSQLDKGLKISKKLVLNKEIKEYFSDLSFIQEINKIRLKISFIASEKQIDNEFMIFFWAILELVKIQFNVESIIFYSFIDDVIKKRESIDKMFSFIGEIDCAISTASIKYMNTEICNPKFVEGKKLSIREMIHPLIKNCIPNDIDLDNKSLLLTGSNMSGKTTFIRAVAINSILSQTLKFAFAKEFSIPFYKVYSSIRIKDNLLEDTSYYLKEVLIIKKFIEISNEKYPSLFILDEIFKGTNTVERISGGKAILSYLNKGNNFVFVSTHDIELTELLVSDNFDLYHFSEKIENNKLFFDHKLKKGKLKTRNAIKILELYDYPKKIIIDAQKTEHDNFE